MITKSRPRISLLLIALIAVSLILAACGGTGGVSEVSTQSEAGSSSAADESQTSEPAAKTDINIIAIKGPTAIGMASLMKSAEQGTAANNYSFTLSTMPDDVTAKVIKGEADIAAVPTNLAAVLYQKTEQKVQLLAVNTLGVLHIIEKGGETVNSFADLNGKTIYASGQGSNPEYILKYLLAENGVDPETDVTIVFKEQNEELVTLLSTEESAIAMLPEPMATSALLKNAEARRALDVSAEWDKLGADSSLMMGCVIVNKAFADNNPEAVAAFLAEYKASIESASSDIDTVASLCEEYEIIASAAVAKAAIPGCNLTFAAGAEIKNAISGYYQILFDANPKSVGGTLPDDEFYYTAE